MGIYGYPGDPLSTLAIFHRIATGTAPLINRSANQILFRPVLGLLSMAFGNVTAYNIFSVAAFILGTLTCHQLISKTTKSGLGAWLAGVSYSFSLYNLWRGMQHLDIIMGVGWLPLYVLALLQFTKTPRRRTALLAALAFSLVFLTSFYIGYFAALFTVGFFLLNRQTLRQPVLSFAAHCSLFAVLCFIFTLPGTYPVLRYYLNPQDPSPQVQNIRQIVESRRFDELVAYGARPWDYLMPSIFHPIFGKYVEGFYTHLKENFTFQFWSPFLPERINFIPMTVLALAGYAVWKVFRDRRSKVRGVAERKNVLTFATMALWMFWVSLPAKITIRRIPFYSPSYFLFRFFPMFRVYARAGIFVLLCVAVLAGYGIKFLTARLSRRKAGLFCLGVGLLIFFENLNFPPFHLLDLSKTPEVYTWLAEQPGELTIVEYPRDTEPGGGCTPNIDPEVRKDFCPSCSLYFQTVHQKALFTGDSLEPEDRQTISDLANPETYRILSENGVDLVIVHTKDPFPQKNPLDSCQSRRIMEKPEEVTTGLKLIKEFDGAVVYEVLP